jgi:O-antigen/teichoic acid export membrane protein
MSRTSLKDATLSGVRWIVIARAATEVVAFGVAVALARMIPPAEFGRAAVALILVPLAVILTFEGFASALVQRKEIEEAHRRTAVFMSVTAGCILSLLTWLLAGIAGGAVFGPEIAGLLRLMSPVFAVASLGAVSRATLWRRLDFRRVSQIDLLSLVMGTLTSLSLAIAGLDAEAIVLGALAQTAAGAVLLLVAAPAPLPRFYRRAQRDISGFGVPAALAGLVHVLFSNVDYAIIAARLTATQTGFYWRAFNLGVVYQEKISGVLVQMAFPVYSRAGGPAELRALHERATRVLSALVFPLLTSLIVLAPLLIPFVFGPAWRPTVVPAQILAVAGMIVAVLTAYPQVMLALGRPKVLLRFNVAMLAVYATAVGVAAPHGLVVVSVTVVGVYAAVLVAVYRLLLGPHLGIRLRALGGELRPAVTCCLGLAAIGLTVRWGLGRAGAPVIVTLAVAGLTGAATYLLALRRLFPALWGDLAMLAGRVLPRLPLRARLLGGRSRRVQPVPTPSEGGAS